MGARAARITAADFLTPPEFRACRLARAIAGQIGGVAPRAGAAGGRTGLGACYQQVPLRVLPPFHFPGEPAALLYLLNPTAGLMDGDGHLVESRPAPGTRAVVDRPVGQPRPSAPSPASRPSSGASASRAGAELVVLPGPNIPFRGCRYYQRAMIDLEGGAALIWGDIWMPGRYARGELSERSPVRADRPGAGGPPRRGAGLPRPVRLARAVGSADGALASGRRLGPGRLQCRRVRHRPHHTGLPASAEPCPQGGYASAGG